MWHLFIKHVKSYRFKFWSFVEKNGKLFKMNFSYRQIFSSKKLWRNYSNVFRHHNKFGQTKIDFKQFWNRKFHFFLYSSKQLSIKKRLIRIVSIIQNQITEKYSHFVANKIARNMWISFKKRFQIFFFMNAIDVFYRLIKKIMTEFSNVN